MYAESISIAASVAASLIGAGTSIFEKRWVRSLIRESETNAGRHVVIGEMGWLKRKIFKGLLKKGILEQSSVAETYILRKERLSSNRQKKLVILAIVLIATLISLLVYGPVSL